MDRRKFITNAGLGLAGAGGAALATPAITQEDRNGNGYNMGTWFIWFRNWSSTICPKNPRFIWWHFRN